MSKLPLFLTFILLLFVSCARAPLKSKDQAMRKISAPMIQDDLPLEPLLKATENEIQYLEKSSTISEFVFGEERFSREEYLKGLYRFIELGRSMKPESFYKTIASEFDFYEVYGQSNWGDAFITSYFEPVIKGSLKKTETFSTPLYQVPNDLVNLDLALFDSRFELKRKLRGRVEKNSFIPYFSREEIDAKGSLNGRKLEICWIDPIDAFFLHIQGSGTVDLGNGKYLYINYADKNGHEYEPIGKFLLEHIPLSQMSLQTIEKYLRNLPKDKLQSYLNKNPSYVFFRNSENHAITDLGVPATGGRTIATDKRFFPKGALALLSFNKPIFANSEDSVPSSFQPVTRFVLDQDLGGVITGGGRVDLFWGQGDQSKRFAGIIKQTGKLYYVAPKRSFQGIARNQQIQK